MVVKGLGPLTAPKKRLIKVGPRVRLALEKGCQIFPRTKNESKLPKFPQIYTKMTVKIPHWHEIRQTFPSQGLPKHTKNGQFGLKSVYPGNNVRMYRLNKTSYQSTKLVTIKRPLFP
jgi:hypothetical protein